MGRPIKKKYFGNLNTATGSLADDGIGGEGIAGISWSTLGSFMGNGAVAPITVPSLPAPTLPGGVQATWSVLFDVESVTTGAGKTDLAVGDTFTWAVVPGLIAKVTDLSGANAIFSVTTTGASRGTPLAVGSLPQDSQTITMTQSGGTGTAGTFVVDVLFRIASATIVESGSGYTGAETFTFTKPVSTVGTVPAGTITLTTTQQNAIAGVAYVTGGSSAVAYDIVKQEASHRYLVTTSEGTSQCKLVADSPSEGEMTIVATDSLGSTYYVTKLTARRALLTRKADGGSGYEYASGAVAGWTLDSPDTGIVSIANA